MCGHDWCSVRISKEIQDFASGKAEGFERVGANGRAGAPVKSAALTPEQREVLEKRGVLTPDEIHRLASKTKKTMSQRATGAGPRAHGAPAPAQTPAPFCHSDYVD